MGKNNRHQKNIKSEKAKVKLKAKKGVKNLPKGLNVTDTTFKVKKIMIREQLKQHDENEILSRRKLNVKDLLTRLQHHNSNVRQEAIRELKEMLSQHSTEILSSQLRPLLQGICGLTLDREKDIRRDSFKVLNSVLGPISTDQLRPFSDVLVSYLCCAMTHIDPNIKEDSLMFLDVLARNCGSLPAENAQKILPNFLDMISKLGSESHPGRQLVTTLSSKNTSVKWRTIVLGRLSTIFSSIISERKSRKLENNCPDDKIVVVGPGTQHAAVYNHNILNICKIDFSETDHAADEPNSDLEDLKGYTKVLMPLMFDSWREVVPTHSVSILACDPSISPEAAGLLKSIAEVIQLLIEYFELLETEIDSRDHGTWLRDNFLSLFEKNLLEKFPYCQIKNVQKPRKRQEDFENSDSNEQCLEPNFSLCYAYVWILTANRNSRIDNVTNRETCVKILNYVHDKLKSWSSNDNAALPHLVKLLKVMFLRASKVFYKSGFTLGEILGSMIEVHARGTKHELQSQLFTILTEIVLDHELEEIHNEKAFRDFMTSLPSLLLKNSIHQRTIRMLNRVVLQYGNWIHKELASKQDKIIENAKNVEIIGSDDDQRSRLMICNLFYFLDEQIYY